MHDRYQLYLFAVHGGGPAPHGSARFVAQMQLELSGVEGEGKVRVEVRDEGKAHMRHCRCTVGE